MIDVLRAALAGLEQKKAEIEQQMASIRKQLGTAGSSEKKLCRKKYL